MDQFTLPTLYKLNESGALQVWDIWVYPRAEGHGEINIRWGQEGGAQQESREVITEGKNLGKKNETSAFTQACNEARSKWEKQQKARKYVVGREKALAGERSEMVLGGYDCMLAHPIEKKPKALKYPCDTQPKLDGHRCPSEVNVVEGVVSVSLWTRSRKPITSMPHIVEAVRAEFQRLVDAGYIGRNVKLRLDGELYFHELEKVPAEFLAEYENPKEAKFQYIGSLIRPQQPVPGYEKVEYHIYDNGDETAVWEKRCAWLVENLDGVRLPLVLVETRRAETEADLQRHEENDIARGYEGLMARNLAGRYVGKRTPDLLKVKRFQDHEFEVIGISASPREVSDSKGTRTLMYVNLRCKLPGWTGPGDELHEFETTINGGQEVQNRILANERAHLGRLVTVKHQGYTADNKPRIPKGLRFREDL